MTEAEGLVSRYRAVRERLRGAVLPPLVARPKPEPKLDAKPERKVDEPLTVNAERLFDWRELLAEVCLRYGVSPHLVLSDCRTARCVQVRADMVHLLRERGWSFCRIGRALGRDHSSIMHLYKNKNCGLQVVDGLRSTHETVYTQDKGES